MTKNRLFESQAFLSDIIWCNEFAVFEHRANFSVNVLEIFGQLREAVASTTEAQHGPAKPGEQRRSCIDARRAAEVLNWRAKIPLSEGLRRTAHWYRNSLSQ